jgi:putative flippase GtrA
VAAPPSTATTPTVEEMAIVSPCHPCERRARAWQVALCGTRVRLRADDVPAQFVRFVTVGVLSTLVYFGVFLSLRSAGDQPANLVGAVLSSMLANDLHRRLTFHAGERVGWLTAQLQGGGLAAAGLVATSLALAALDGLFGTAWWGDLLLIAGVTGAVGLARFVALRLWVFAAHVHRPMPQPA